MKTAKEYAYEYFAPDAPDELDIDIIKCIITDHDNELISEIEKKIEEENNFDKSDPTQDYYWQERVAGIKTKALTEIINLIKEK